MTGKSRIIIEICDMPFKLDKLVQTFYVKGWNIFRFRKSSIVFHPIWRKSVDRCCKIDEKRGNKAAKSWEEWASRLRSLTFYNWHLQVFSYADLTHLLVNFEDSKPALLPGFLISGNEIIHPETQTSTLILPSSSWIHLLHPICQ